MVTQYIRHRSCNAHRGLRSSTGLATHRASSSHDQGIVPAGSTGVHCLSDAGISPLALHLDGLSSPPAGRTSMDETDYAGAAAGKEVGFSLVRISPCLSLTWDP